MKEGNRICGFIETLVFMILSVLVLGVVRVFLMFRFVDYDVLVDNVGSLPLMLFNALRFDLQVWAYLVLPLFVFALIQFFLYKCLTGALVGFARVYTPIIMLIVALLAIGDVHFYQNFDQHYNMVVFDFFDENPSVLIEGIIEEAPIGILVVGSLLALLLSVGGRMLLLRLFEGCVMIGWRRWVLGIFVFLLVPISVRGSLGTFPLRAEDVYVSSSSKINDCVPNGIFMLKKAWSEKKKQFVLESEEAILRSHGFVSMEEALEVMSVTLREGGECDVESLSDVMFVPTEDSAKACNYNVLLILTESWSNALIDYEQSLGADLLCGMGRHFEEDYLYRNFLSAANSTIDAVEFMTVSSEHPRLFTSGYRRVEYPSATARLWKEAGYKTSFVSGIEISWRNLMEVLPNQGFDKVMGKYELLGERPNAECNTTWGVYDHDMLSYIVDELNTSDGPKFIMALTSTSHTPFEFPSDFEFPSIEIDDETRHLFATSDDVTMEYLRGYQYENKSLADFLDKFKKSAASQNTIVAITGDHNIRQILSIPESEEWKRYSVPLYLYLPESIRSEVTYDGCRYGSHYDIVPTLANLTVSGGKYFNTGQDLLSDTLLYPGFGVNKKWIIGASGDNDEQQTRIAEARRALTKIYFQRLWAKK